jgi:hypothetical protein
MEDIERFVERERERFVEREREREIERESVREISVKRSRTECHIMLFSK